jgi:lipopolysaccharide export system protein LptA
MTTSHRPIFAALTLAVSLSMFSDAAFAERADRDKPTNVEADQMSYDESKQVNTFIGNVVLTRGTLLMRAEKLVIRQDAAGYQFATLFAPASGMATFRQKRDGGKDLWIEGQAADRIEYDTKNEVAKLFRKAHIKMLDSGKPTDEVEGEFISYDTRAEFYTVNNTTSGESKPGGGRVRATIQPREKDAAGNDK